MKVRGLIGPPPVVAAGANPADPYYVPAADKTAEIHRGDLIVISIAAKIDKPETVYAAQTWCAVAAKTAPGEIEKVFQTVSLARPDGLGLARRARRGGLALGRRRGVGRLVAVVSRRTACIVAS